tara:strand:- start:10333 stop:11040 length:708 start_codon:yes stop_codon:yes gene_type:complete
MNKEVPSKAVLLVGGKGTRLRPITYSIPKALIDVNGKTITEHLVELLKGHGVQEVVFSVGYLKEKIKDHFKTGENHGVKVSYIEEEDFLGTAGPLLLHKDNLNETFIAGNGDELKEIDIKEMYKFHKESGGLATLALTKVEDPTQYGVADIDGNKIKRFVEKPSKEEAPSNLINAGFYIMEPEVIDLIKPGFCMLEQDVFPQLAEQGKLFGFPFSGKWFDVGTHERYEIAKREWK